MTTENHHINVLIVDDHPFFRQGLKTVLESIDNLTITGEAENGKTALLMVETLKPDMIFLDLSMPEINGFQVLEQLQDFPDLKKIIMTSFNDTVYMKKAFELGASGFILKDNGQAEMASCVQLVMAGGQYISPSIQANKKGHNTLIMDDAKELIDALTKTELKVMSYLGNFMTSKEIANKMFISYRTVQNHRRNIKQKLELSGMHQLTRMAQQYQDEINNYLEQNQDS